MSKDGGMQDNLVPEHSCLEEENTKMTGIQTLFPRSSFVGFDHLFNEMEHTVRHAADHYPPHNIIRASEHEYLIELAVAGFSKDELSIILSISYSEIEILVKLLM